MQEYSCLTKIQIILLVFWNRNRMHHVLCDLVNLEGRGGELLARAHLKNYSRTPQFLTYKTRSVVGARGIKGMNCGHPPTHTFTYILYLLGYIVSRIYVGIAQVPLRLDCPSVTQWDYFIPPSWLGRISNLRPCWDSSAQTTYTGKSTWFFS